MREAPLLRVEHLKKFFSVRKGLWQRKVGYIHAVDDISLEIRAGDVLGLVGESGCGKSTLGQTLLRLYTPDAGKILFSGQDITSISQARLRTLRQKMQMIFQDPYSSLSPRMRVGDIIKEPFLIHKIGTKKERDFWLGELLEAVGLSLDFAKRYVHEFSGGQRQRIGIARALSLRPSFIVADEPVSALDVSIQAQIINLMIELRKKFKLSYLFIAHDLSVVQFISDHLAVMYLGKIIEYSSAEFIHLEAKHPYTQILIEAVPKLSFLGSKDVGKKKKISPVGIELADPMKPPSGCRFRTRCPLANKLCAEKEPNLRNISTKNKPHFVACHYA